jgi:CHAT domain-containing protein
VAVDSQGAAADVKDVEPRVTDAIREFAENLRKPRPDEHRFDISGYDGIALEDLVPARLIPRITQTETLVVIPHGVLHLLPWACLGHGAARLFELTAVGILPNLASFSFLDEPFARSPRVAVIGDADYSRSKSRYGQLEEARPEIEDVETIHAGRLVARPRTGHEATESGFWELAAACQGNDVLLHYCGHGTVDATEPLASGLLLTGSTVDAAEILLRRLPYREVVLSACSTAWRPQSTHGLELAGDDALGLPASFLEAGAGFVMANIPPVREKPSRMFSVAWHRHRQSGKTPLQAYRAVQLEAYAAQPETIHTWAGTTAYGCR